MVSIHHGGFAWTIGSRKIYYGRFEKLDINRLPGRRSTETTLIGLAGARGTVNSQLNFPNCISRSIEFPSWRLRRRTTERRHRTADRLVPV
jgi:hypothetical protein